MNRRPLMPDIFDPGESGHSSARYNSWSDDRRHRMKFVLPALAATLLSVSVSQAFAVEQGAAAMVLYEDGQGRRISFYIRPPGPDNGFLPKGSRSADGLRAQYWSGAGYNYAMVSPENQPVTPLLSF